MAIELYYPLKAGRRAVYRYSDPERPDLTEARRTTLAVAQDGAASTADWLEDFNGTRPFQRRWRSRLDAQALLEDGVRLLTEPLQAGRSWQDGPDTYRLVSLEERVSVPAGAFSGCLRLDFGNDDLGGACLLYAPGVGLVRREQWGERGPHLYELLRIEA